MEAPEKLYFGKIDKSILDIYSTKESDNEKENNMEYDDRCKDCPFWMDMVAELD